MEKIILAGPMVGEFGWEVLRFAPHILWLKHNKHKNRVKLVVYTRPERFDLYGNSADILEPLDIEGDVTKLQADCFKLTGFPDLHYQKLAQKLKLKYSSKYDVVEHVFPAIMKRQYTEKAQYNIHQMRFNFIPRLKNREVFDSIIPNDKPLVALAPRFRKQGKKRNWPYWPQLYELISTDAYLQKFNFILCGRPPEYIPDEQKRFFDVNDILIQEDTSLVGYTIEALRRSILTVGSQSGIPNLSNLVRTPTLQWGHEQHAHATKYNVKKTPTQFLLDKKYNLPPETIIEEMKKILKRKEK